jgi:hypothetical protein
LVWFTVVVLVLSVLLGIGTWRYLKRQEAGEAGPALKAPASGALRPAKRAKVAAGLKDFWEVEDIRRGVLVLSGGRYRAVCRISAADFWLLSDQEQNAVEDALRAALMQLTFPVQFLVTAEAVDTRGAAEELREAAARLPGALADMAQARAEWLAALMRERQAAARQAYLVVPFETQKGFEHAAGELWARVSNLAEALAGAKMRLEPLSSEALADLLSHLLNRGRAWRPSAALEEGVLCLYHVGERQVG